MGEQPFDGQLQAVDGEEDGFGEDVGKGDLVVAEACQHGLDRMHQRRCHVDLAQRRVALDVVHRAEETADDFAIFGGAFQLGDIALDIRRLVDQGLEKLFQTVAVVD